MDKVETGKAGNLKQIQSRLDSKKVATTLLVIRDLFLVKISRCLETRENKSKDLIATATVTLEEGKCLPTSTNMFIMTILMMADHRDVV